MTPELVPFTEADIDRVISWIPSLEALYLWTANSFAFPLNREHLRQHIRECAERGDRLLYNAVDLASREAFGYVELGAIDRRNRSLRIGRVLIDPQRRGCGLGAAMMRAALSVAFDRMGMHRVELGVFDVNPRAIATYERVGFRRDGVRRESFKAIKGYWSEIIMSILAPEWEALRTGP